MRRRILANNQQDHVWSQLSSRRPGRVCTMRRRILANEEEDTC